MSANETNEALKRSRAKADGVAREGETVRRITVDKKTHRIRSGDETEGNATINIENRNHINSE